MPEGATEVATRAVAAFQRDALLPSGNENAEAFVLGATLISPLPPTGSRTQSSIARVRLTPLVTHMIPICPTRLPEDLTNPIQRFAAAWVASPLRPRVSQELAWAWETLVEEWILTPALPLYIRKSSATRGQVLTHATGRLLVPCDNTTAVWAFTLALEGECPSLQEVGAFVQARKIPYSFTGLRGRFAQFYAAGWKLAHIMEVGLQTREQLERLPITTLEDHFRKLVLPSNMFAIPKAWAGLGEIPEIIEAIRSSGEHKLPASMRAAARARSPLMPRASRASTQVPVSEERAMAVANRVLPSSTYQATRLLFKASVIEGLTDDQLFRIETPEGTYEMTKTQFRTTFSNVAESDTYRRTGVYSYNRTPEKARRHMISEPGID